MWCIAKITHEYLSRMYRLLDLYESEYDEDYPVVCMDEKSKQLIEDIRKPIPMRPGSVAKHDYEYKRNGTRNIFVAVEPKAGNRVIAITKTRKKKDFACFIRALANRPEYKRAIKIRLVVDNLNTHFEKSFFETFAKKEAEAILKRIDFIYTPKHGSWLNMAEIEINVMDRQCLGKKIGSEKLLKQRIRPWAKARNQEKKKINWTFKRQDADRKLSKFYAP